MSAQMITLETTLRGAIKEREKTQHDEMLRLLDLHIKRLKLAIEKKKGLKK